MDRFEQARAVRALAVDALHEAATLRRRIDDLRWACEDLEDALIDLDQAIEAHITPQIQDATNAVVEIYLIVTKMTGPLG
ncbi:MAG: hypothetical protein AAGI46_06070 [Planctomycetota bacterium]